jgi:Protein of unknown function (DUF3048) N-terminal domain/Protein of unknown function (DUF3048) C-terminal domain
MRRIPLVVVAALVLGGVAANVSGADTTTTTTTSSPTTTTTVVHRRVAALTGLPDPTAVTKRRSALTIKMDNTPKAHPQYGVNEADVVYEEIVEGGITRLAAIFNSQLPTKVGPVRSVRRTDREIVFPIGGIFAFSGGAQYAISSIETAPVKLIDQSNAGAAMFRDLKRPPPHNLFANAVLLMKEGGKVHPPPAIFTYVARNTPAAGAPVGSFTVNFGSGFATSYQWDAKTHDWLRSIFGAPDVTATGVRVAPTNVIVMSVDYYGGVGVEGSYAQMVGSGPVEIFSDGHLQKGKWFRRNIHLATAYRTASGKVIALRPGQTWVELLASDETVSVYAPA